MIVGSTAFFKDIKGFKSKDIDVLELIDDPIGFKIYRQCRFKNKCVFQWKNLPIDEFIKYELFYDTPMSVNKFLVPEFIKLKGVTIEHLKQLKPLVDKMDNKHLYLKTIYDAYMKNNCLTLTDDQLMEAYDTYLEYR